jgi:hypothetical protein
MKKALKRIRRSSARKAELANELAELKDQERELKARISALTDEAKKLFKPGEQVGRVTITPIKTKVITKELEDALRAEDVWNDILTVPKPDMKKLASVLKTCPHFQKHLAFKETLRVDVAKE